MSLLRRLRNTVRPPLRRLQGSDEDAHFRLRLPARGGQEGDWLAFDCVVTTHEDAHGEHLLIRDAAENLVASIALDRPQHESHDEIYN